MNFLDEFTLKIRKRETPAFDRLFRLAIAMRSFEIPVVKSLHGLLYCERKVRLQGWRDFLRVFYFTPLFKSQCESVGKRLRIIGGIPQILGPLRIKLGDDVVVHGASTFIGAKVFDKPTLVVGKGSHLGYQLAIVVGCDVTIGNNVLIGNSVTILSYDGHSTAPSARHLPAPPESSRPITIMDNVWIGANCSILKGVTIGENSVIAVGSVVTTKIPPNTLAIGNPARCFPLMLT